VAIPFVEHSLQPLLVGPFDALQNVNLSAHAGLDVEQVVQVLKELSVDVLGEDLGGPLA